MISQLLGGNAAAGRNRRHHTDFRGGADVVLVTSAGPVASPNAELVDEGADVLTASPSWGGEAPSSI
ncbi:hypothetical protein [Mycobacterium sp.]|uniref:hypothetical protein n=1 Tax=Mycobacterium sp. TaxID=1785 RepID=UPI0025F3B990|nr:hypothetical protein [Mycobacterium sp.]MBW0015182.1 hypothetical protein [Mycobacterium sp.]